MATQTTNYNFPLTDDATTTFSSWWQTINGDNNYSLAVLVDAAIAGVASDVGSMVNLHFEVVATLPVSDQQTNAIYLVPKTTPGLENVYDEYIWYNNNWELIGTTAVDLSNYVTKTGSESISNKTITDSTYNGYTLGGACAKSVDASISDITSINLPTSAAVAGYTDSSLDSVSTKPIQNQAVYNALANKQDSLTTLNVPSGTLDESIGFDSGGNLVRGAGGGGGGSIDKSSVPSGTIQDSIGFNSLGNLVYQSKSGIEYVKGLPTATEDEYNKHKLYLFNNDLYYIACELTGSPVITTLSDVIPNYSNSNIKVVQTPDVAYFVSLPQSDNIYMFDPKSSTYTTIMAINHSVAQNLGQLPNIALVGDSIYCVGTYNVWNTYKFNLNTQETTTYSSTGVGANRTSIGVYGTDIFIIGGYNDNTAIRKFDTISNTRTVLAATMPSDTRAAGTVVVGSKMYMFGTQNSSTNIYIFDMVTQTVTTSNASIPYTYGGGGSFLVHGSKIDIVWGQNVNGSYSNNYILQYDMIADTCVDTGNTMPTNSYTYLYTYAQFGKELYMFAVSSSKNITKYTYNATYSYKKITSTN